MCSSLLLLIFLLLLFTFIILPLLLLLLHRPVVARLLCLLSLHLQHVLEAPWKKLIPDKHRLRQRPLWTLSDIDIDAP